MTHVAFLINVNTFRRVLMCLEKWSAHKIKPRHVSGIGTHMDDLCRDNRISTRKNTSPDVWYTYVCEFIEPITVKGTYLFHTCVKKSTTLHNYDECAKLSSVVYKYFNLTLFHAIQNWDEGCVGLSTAIIEMFTTKMFLTRQTGF